jgi:cytoskeletal protein CcmA (bactofilin family)
VAKSVPESYEEIEAVTNTVMSPDIDFVGDMRFKTSLMIKGKMKGTVRAEGHFIVAPGAVVEATVEAAKVTNYGSITGEILAKDCLEMKKGATQLGNVTTPDIMVELGCCINGDVRMQKP